jgi:hypothetical protein
MEDPSLLSLSTKASPGAHEKKAKKSKRRSRKNVVKMIEAKHPGSNGEGCTTTPYFWYQAGPDPKNTFNKAKTMLESTGQLARDDLF